MAKRVQIPAYTDRWMMGDRYGEVLKVTTAKGSYALPEFEVAHVKLDKSGKMIRCVYEDCTPV